MVDNLDKSKEDSGQCSFDTYITSAILKLCSFTIPKLTIKMKDQNFIFLAHKLGILKLNNQGIESGFLYVYF
jgi:hypothetical protein